jgi:hypothetical protein
MIYWALNPLFIFNWRGRGRKGRGALLYPRGEGGEVIHIFDNEKSAVCGHSRSPKGRPSRNMYHPRHPLPPTIPYRQLTTTKPVVQTINFFFIVKKWKKKKWLTSWRSANRKLSNKNAIYFNTLENGQSKIYRVFIPMFFS